MYMLKIVTASNKSSGNYSFLVWKPLEHRASNFEIYRDGVLCIYMHACMQR